MWVRGRPVSTKAVLKRHIHVVLEVGSASVGAVVSGMAQSPQCAKVDTPKALSQHIHPGHCRYQDGSFLGEMTLSWAHAWLVWWPEMCVSPR